jgi:hypothetical protein
MVQPRLTNCEECVTIANLINEIDCKLTELAKKQYSNIIYSLGNSVSEDLFIDLITYRRILTYKSYDEEYAECYTLANIASKVKLLIFK